MRMKIDQEVQLVDIKGQVYSAVLIDDTSDRATFKLLELLAVNTELPLATTIFIGLPKGDKLELVTQKATELGVQFIVPVAMKRSVTKWDQKKQHKKVERLQKIAQQAAEQSKRNIVPQVLDLHLLQDVINRLSEYNYFCIADEEVAKEGKNSQLAQVYRQLQAGQHIAYLFGPEGGIDRQEIDKLMAASTGQVYQTALGPRILRAETAPLYALSTLSYVLELLKK